MEPTLLLADEPTGELDAAPMRTDPVFCVAVPVRIDGVPAKILDPRLTWASSEEYDTRAAQLAEMFRENFEQFAEDAGDKIRSAGPALVAGAH